jgi:hypothetical protein
MIVSKLAADAVAKHAGSRVTAFAHERLTLNSLLQKLVDAWRNRALPAKAASFALVGVVNTLIDVNVFAIAYGYLVSH